LGKKQQKNKQSVCVCEIPQNESKHIVSVSHFESRFKYLQWETIKRLYLFCQNSNQSKDTRWE